jgi:tRNA G10  N-methylase Trm11
MLIGLLTAPYAKDWLLKELKVKLIKFKLVSFSPLRTQELVVIETTAKSFIADREKFLELRLVEDVFLLLTFERTLHRRSELAKLLPHDIKTKILEALPHKFNKHSPKQSTTFNIFVKQDRDYNLFKKEIVGYIRGTIEVNFNRWRYSDPASIELWGFYASGKFSLALRLTELDFRQRQYKIRERSGSLRPTLAALLAFISQPKKSDRILDPMCGVGTILIERSLLGPYATLSGGDIDAEAVELANANLARGGLEERVVCWDAGNKDILKLALEGKKVNKIVTNLPFGKKFETSRPLTSFYNKLLKTWLEIIEPQGEMYILTSEIKTLVSCLKKISSTNNETINNLKKVSSYEVIATLNVQGIEAKVLYVAIAK